MTASPFDTITEPTSVHRPIVQRNALAQGDAATREGRKLFLAGLRCNPDCTSQDSALRAYFGPAVERTEVFASTNRKGVLSGFVVFHTRAEAEAALKRYAAAAQTLHSQPPGWRASQR